MYLFEYLGAVYLWCFIAIKNKLRGREIPKFKEILYNYEDDEVEIDIIDQHAYGINLKLIGFIVTMIICYLLIEIRI